MVVGLQKNSTKHIEIFQNNKIGGQHYGRQQEIK